MQAPDVEVQALGLWWQLPACFSDCSGGWPVVKGSAAVGVGAARKPRWPRWGEAWERTDEQTGTRRVRAPQRSRGRRGGRAVLTDPPSPDGAGAGAAAEAWQGPDGVPAGRPGPGAPAASSAGTQGRARARA